MTTTKTPPILVAVDASPESLAALNWAIDHAVTLGHRLRIITAVGTPNGPSTDSARRHFIEIEHAELLASERVRSALDQADGLQNLDYEHILAIGSIDRVLRSHSHDASMAVVGTRTPKTRMQRIFQKSVTNKLTGSLACPVVSVTLAADESLAGTHRQQLVAP